MKREDIALPWLSDELSEEDQEFLELIEKRGADEVADYMRHGFPLDSETQDTVSGIRRF